MKKDDRQVIMVFIGGATYVLQKKLQWETTAWARVILQKFLLSNYFLQLENMKRESLVIANQHVAVNLYLDLAQTARHVSEVSLRKKNKVIFFIRFTTFN
jgi:hypothetical protein